MYNFLLVRHCNYNSILYHFRVIWRDLEIWLRGHSRSVKLVSSKSLGTVSYSPSIVTMAIYVAVWEIFSVKECCDLEKRVRVCSRSFEMAPFDRSHTSYYSPSIVTMAMSCIIYLLNISHRHLGRGDKWHTMQKPMANIKKQREPDFQLVLLWLHIKLIGPDLM